jgi:hypothetical protein
MKRGSGAMSRRQIGHSLDTGSERLTTVPVSSSLPFACIHFGCWDLNLHKHGARLSETET